MEYVTISQIAIIAGSLDIGSFIKLLNTQKSKEGRTLKKGNILNVITINNKKFTAQSIDLEVVELNIADADKTYKQMDT